MKSSAAICLASLRPALAGICLLAALICNTAIALADDDIADYFALYYGQHVAGGQYQGALQFLRDAAEAHANAATVLKAGPSRSIFVDRGNGYLRIDDSSGSGTAQTLTMAVYRKADGSDLLVVGGSDCDDACDFSVQLFVASTDQLQPVPLHAVIPPIEPKQFIKPGHPMPKKLASGAPTINYVPARVGTALTLTPWFGYEIEETMSSATRALIRNLVLDWDAKLGRFVRLHDGGFRAEVTLPPPGPGAGAALPPPASRRTGPSLPR